MRDICSKYIILNLFQRWNWYARIYIFFLYTLYINYIEYIAYSVYLYILSTIRAVESIQSIYIAKLSVEIEIETEFIVLSTR